MLGAMEKGDPGMCTKSKTAWWKEQPGGLILTGGLKARLEQIKMAFMKMRGGKH